MTQKEYIKALVKDGHKLVNENQLSLGTLIFDINEGDMKMAGGVQHTFWLTLSSQSDLNLAPNPWK